MLKYSINKPAHDSDAVRIGTLYVDEEPLTIGEIEEYFGNKKKVIMPCKLFFQSKMRNNKWVRLIEVQPDVIISRDDFVRCYNTR